MVFAGSFLTGALRDQRGRELPFEVRMHVVPEAGGTARITQVTVMPTASQPLSAEILRHVASWFEQYADQQTAQGVVQYEAYRAALGLEADFTWPTVAPGYGDEAVKGVERELARRRRSRLADDDYREVARVYREASESGQPAQRAVAKARGVSESRAAALIGEARRRGLLPPARPGRKQSI